MDVARSAPQGAHYHADVIYLLYKMRIKKGASAYWYNELRIHQLGSRPTVFIPRWTATRGARGVVHCDIKNACREPAIKLSSHKSCYEKQVMPSR